MEISLKTSVLIQKLMEIDKTVPFDADVVTGEEWWPIPISRVYHNPPHTFVEFETGEQSQDDPDELTIYSELEIRVHQMIQIRDFVQSNKNLQPEEIISELNVQIERLRAMAEANLKQ
ncbi:hypothetical protein DU808_25730 [Salmonella enterica subsp. enterica]|uniref:Uncharacterized protein n=6 Tax=Salmonella enterica I TaxID=59201 RepID=A0A3Y9SPG5_SALET|nr:hypothetical protein SCH_1246 [Salmonella enterica subsp. enterica serovar Choleraesuis str. SC-B67]AIK92460.1 hypothetical protein EL48_06645 [Salmonella enterica subsp. enterica serovar Choleraesuis]AXQ03486.1 hypothetical protein SEEC0708_25605 [Salmonella enterica subsp. enterica serovar Choleraesuis str. ATCC 10708]EAA9463032.1 hypothetical protein [Salmonella enterica]EAA9666085.1 hypothetical protein [Salmonella enterica subsp. enterica serovar Infantis]EAW2187048.1 hypothetical prot